MRSITFVVFISLLIAGCGNSETENPIEVTAIQPIATFIKSIPASGSKVSFGDIITLHFTQAPENLSITEKSVYVGSRNNPSGYGFFIREIHYNGANTATFKLINNSGSPDPHMTMVVLLEWTHGYVVINFQT